MSPARKHFHLVLLTLATDIAAIVVSFLLTYLLRFISGVIPFTHQAPFLVYVRTLLVVVPVYIWMFRSYGLYQASRHIRRIEEIFQVIKAISFAIVILMAITFFYRDLTYSRVYLLMMWVISILTVSVARYYLIQWEYHRKRKKNLMTKVLVIGSNRNARQIVRWSKNNPHYGHEVIGVLAREPHLVGKHLEGISILGVCGQWESFVSHLQPDRVVLVDPDFTRAETTELVALCEDQFIEFKLAADFFGLLTRNVDVDYVSTVPLLGFRALPLDDFWNRFLKRTFDLVVTGIILILSFPVWIPVIIAIKLDDGGPIFYKQERVGRDFLKFDLLKFRTMKMDAEKETGPVWAKPNDSRRTRIGNFLRRWNIDELPQLLNVLRGQMSLVGPRPERPHFIQKFRSEVPRYMARHKIKSGLTGWAQVNGFRGNTSISERIKYDLYYMENWSLLFDIEILFMTFAAFRNAY
jgi:exopolysaccharide biosynthesis polyprenyl glycosylphosphotransferase